MGSPGIESVTAPIAFFFITLAFRAVFSFLETSVTALRLFKLKELAQTNTRYASLFDTLEKNPHRVLITILIANNLADMICAALATSITEQLFAGLNLSSGLGFSVGIGMAALAILIFGEIIPKNIAKSRGDKLFNSTLWIINILFYVCYPIVSFLTKFSDFIISCIGGNKTDESSTEWVSSEKEIQFLISYINQKGLIETEKTEMLQNIFDLGSIPIKEIMVPATEIISVSAKATIKETLNIFSKHHFTRLPVYADKLDNVVGMVHLKDVFTLLSKNEDKPLKDITRTIFFVPESMKVNQLLRELRQQHQHIAMVINEHGIITGLITLEDVLEEIVGDISDEHENANEKIVTLKQGGWLVDGSTSLEDLSDHLDITFESEDSLTLGGFLTEQLQHLPKIGERIIYKTFTFQVQKASNKRVLQVLVFKDKILEHDVEVKD